MTTRSLRSIARSWPRHSIAPGVGIGMGSVHASSDGKLVLGTADTQVKYWPIADYAAYKTASSNGMTGAQWQPGTAVGLGLPKGGGSDVTEHILMRLSDGASVTFEVTGTLTASVRLR